MAAKNEKKMNFQLFKKVIFGVVIVEIIIAGFFIANARFSKITKVVQNNEVVDQVRGRLSADERKALLIDQAHGISANSFTTEKTEIPEKTVIENHVGEIVYNKPGHLEGKEKEKVINRLLVTGKIQKTYDVKYTVTTVIHRIGDKGEVLEKFPGKLKPKEITNRLESLGYLSQGIENVGVSYNHVTEIKSDNWNKIYHERLVNEKLETEIEELVKHGYLVNPYKISYIEGESITTINGPNTKRILTKPISDEELKTIIDELCLDLIKKKGYRFEYEIDPQPVSIRLWVASSICIPLGFFLIFYILYLCIEEPFNSLKNLSQVGNKKTKVDLSKEKSKKSQKSIIFDVIANSNIIIVSFIIWLTAFLGLWVIPESLFWIKDNGIKFLKDLWFVFVPIIVAGTLAFIAFMYFKYKLIANEQNNEIKVRLKLLDMGKPQVKDDVLLLPYNGGEEENN